MTTLDFLPTMTPSELETLVFGLDRVRHDDPELETIYERAVEELERKVRR
jgi:hypothetical protein